MDQVLRFWWAFELFSPQPLPELTRGDSGGGYTVMQWRPGNRLPWEYLRPPDKGLVWEYTVYAGLYRCSWIYGHLEEAFQTGGESYDQRQPGDTACAAFLVDQEGLLVADTAVLSSAAWSLGKLRGTRPLVTASLPGLLGAFPDVNTQFCRTVTEEHRMVSEEGVVPLGQGQIEAILQEAHATAGVHGMNIAQSGVRIKCVQVKERKDGDEPPRTDFLNSMYLYELEDVRHAIAAGDCGIALHTYLTPDGQIAEHRRQDVMDDEVIGEVVSRTSADRMPWGRWPSNPAHSLALSQQFAADEALDVLGTSGGLMGVNGPPGTGKTTMLREIIAANVVGRAQQLAKLTKPEEGFLASAGPNNRQWQLRPELTGFEMVVVSSNNTAVENVSNELPAKSALHEQWQGTADYFGATATDVLQAASSAARANKTQAWGLIAARLGKKQNRRKFAEAFWFGTANDRNGPVPSPIKEVLRQSNTETAPTWPDAVAAFRSAERQVQMLLAPRQEAGRRRDELAAALPQIASLEAELDQHNAQLAHIREQLSQNSDACDGAAAHIRELDRQYRAHATTRPSWWRTFIDGPQERDAWRAHAEQLRQNRATAFNEYSRRAQAVTQLRSAAAAVEHSTGALGVRLAPLQQRVRDLKVLAAADEADVPGYPTKDWLQDEHTREAKAPWLDDALNQARSELFLAAMDLHRAFFKDNDKSVGRLAAAVDVVLGKPPFGLPPTAVAHAWQLLFLMVPVVSTTFASMGTMFNSLGPESLGWLFIDEAGQAKPQDAVGAIWRSRRVLAVGDPRQLQPIVVMPKDAEDTIGRAFGVSGTWVPSRTSVQALADRIGLWGTSIQASGAAASPGTAQPTIWVSAPLRVHRRCDEPMFSICNHIAYGGIMIKGRDCQCDELPPSSWIDVPNPKSGYRVQDKEIHELGQLVELLINTHGVAENNIFVVSPFRPVVDRMKAQILDKHPGMSGGTVHSVQGQEAPVVILVLGGDPARPRSKTWAGGEPHLVNVAVSRAQHRLYVIGDHCSWSQIGHFKTLSERVPVSDYPFTF